MKRRAKIGLVVLGVVGVSLWSVYRETHGVGVDSVSWLPKEAHNITYVKNDTNVRAEFDIEQDAFEKWCEKRGWPLRELAEGEFFTVVRCLLFLERKGIIPPLAPSQDANSIEADLAAMERFSKTFDAGDLVFEERWNNNGGYSIGYDVDAGRGYYAYSSH